jgi:hypothetical protein
MGRWGAAGLVNRIMSRHAFLRPDFLNAIANCPLRPTTAGHPDSQRTPNQALPSLTIIVQGVESGLSAGPVFRVMACREHRAFCAHMEPITSHETDSGRENVSLGPGNGPAAITRPMGRKGDRWFENWEHSATCVSTPSG